MTNVRRFVYNVRNYILTSYVMASTILSTKYQLVIPSEIRQKMDLKVGDKLEVTVSPDQSYLIVRPVVKNWTKNSRGLGKKTWEKVDTEKYHQEFKQSLERE